MKKDFFLSFLKNLSLFGPCPKRLTRGVLQPRSLFYECRSFFRFRKYFLKLRVHPGDEVAQRLELPTNPNLVAQAPEVLRTGSGQLLLVLAVPRGQQLHL